MRAIGRPDAAPRGEAHHEPPQPADPGARSELVAFLESRLDDYPHGALSRERLEDVIRTLSEAEGTG